MPIRQKIVLHMLGTAGRPVSRLELTKWCFLLAEETPSGGGKSFYQFLPYQVGPFSFCLYREVGALVQGGHVAETLAGQREAWHIGDRMDRPGLDLPRAVREDAAHVVRNFRDQPPDALLNYVYERFPWFTVNSTRRRLQVRPVAPPGIYTVGYEGWSVDGFLNLLIRTGLKRVLDVRSNPVSRQYGFHKSTLARLCEHVGIEYLHFPELGIPPRLRRGLITPADYETLFVRYEQDTLEREAATVEKVAALVATDPTALMCMESDASRCHRSRLAEKVRQKTCLPVLHVGTLHEARV